MYTNIFTDNVSSCDSHNVLSVYTGCNKWRRIQQAGQF